MTPSQAIAARGTSAWDIPVEIEGVLVAAGPYSHLADEGADDPARGVLIDEPLLDPLDALAITRADSGLVRFRGRVSMLCGVTSTGLSMLPARIAHVFTMTYSDDDNPPKRFEIDAPKYDVLVRWPEVPKGDPFATMHGMMPPGFGAMLPSASMTEQFAKQMKSVPPHPLAQRVSGSALQQIEASLKASGASYDIVPCKLVNGKP